jgi:hypothetical protein
LRTIFVAIEMHHDYVSKQQWFRRDELARQMLDLQFQNLTEGFNIALTLPQIELGLRVMRSG